MIRNALRIALLSALPLTSFAHDGHGLSGMHWHATDSWGFVVTAAVVVAVVIYFRKK